jgi:hypothetical protein
MGNLRARGILIRESICYHSPTDLGAHQACADRFVKAAHAIPGGAGPEQFLEVFLARKRVA